MNAELQAALLALVQSAVAEIPPILSSLVFAARIEHAVNLLLGVVILWNVRRVGRFIVSRVSPNGVDDATDYIPACVACGIMVLVGFLMVGTSIHPLLMAWFAPKAYLVEWARGAHQG